VPFLLFAVALLSAPLTWLPAVRAARDRLPNVVIILADDLGYGDLGCYGQKLIQTPRLDRMAAEGLRFTQFYAGSTVCAPSRYVLMTGKDTGHGHIRGNAGEKLNSLNDKDVTIAQLMQRAGYKTALCGKWGLGAAIPGNQGLPRKQGFDLFFGYLNQVHAHNYYPDYLWLNEEKRPLSNIVPPLAKKSPGGVATKKAEYSPDLVRDMALKFVKEHRDEPFFLYWATTMPHANNEATTATGNGEEVPDVGIYSKESWPDADKGQAAMITRLDSDVGQLLDTLRELDIDDNTLVLFSSDNGPHHEGGQDTKRFDPNGPLRGMKRDLYEGGIRVPLIARWPGTVPADHTSDHISYLGDIYATLADLTSQPPPQKLQSISILPTLEGRPTSQHEHESLYWEFYEQDTKQAVRSKNWKAVRVPMLTGKTELYDLATDIGETKDVAAEHPDVVRNLEQMMTEAHVPDPNWKAKKKK
jgi:arylsulfatase A-like enzyme